MVRVAALLVLMTPLTTGCLDDGYYGEACTQYVVYARAAPEPGPAPVDIRNSTEPALRELNKDFRWVSEKHWVGNYETYHKKYDHIRQHLANLSVEQNGTPDWTSVIMSAGTADLKYGTDNGCTD